MKTCKFCNAELPEGTSVCPACGKDNEATAQHTEAAGGEPLCEQTSVTPEAAAQSAEVQNAPKDNKNLSVGKTVLAIAAVVAVVILAVGVLLGIQHQPQEEEGEIVQTAPAATQETVETEPPTVPADGNPDDVTCKGTYTAADETVIAARDTVVATAGEYELTVGQLQVYYWMEMRNFMSQYGAYASYFGLDINQSLDTQVCGILEEGWTWQQYFLQAALNTWHNYRAMAAEADANGYELTDAQKDAIENAAVQLDEAATANGFESGIAMVHTSLGAAAEIEDYVYFMEMYYKANGYYNQLASQIHPTDQDLEDFFEAHADGYKASGITKDTKSVNVRHVLIYPEGADGTNIFTEEFSEEAWAAGEETAKAILEEFLAGEQTEEAFAALAGEHSQDPGSNQNGGLYEGVKEGEMVTAFNDWCFDPERQVGDTGIVKTEYGYHVMYFSGSELLWKQYVESDFVTENANTQANEIAAKHPFAAQYENILLAQAELF